MDPHSLVFAQSCFKIGPSKYKNASAKTEFYMK